MNALWSKAGQAHRCGCGACKTAMASAGRRVTMAPKRRATFAEIFTACYSSVFASAAVIDAIRKEDRRQDLDQQLEEARRDLADLREKGDDLVAETGLIRLHDRQMRPLWLSLVDVYEGRPHYKEMHKPAVLRESALRAWLQREHYGCPDEASMQPVRQKTLMQLDEALLSEEEDRSIHRRDPNRESDLKNLCYGVRRLVDNLAHKAGIARRGKRGQTANAVSKLMDEGYPRYSFRWSDADRAYNSTRELIEANRAAIADRTLDQKEVASRVSYNLLIAAFPPDTHVVNSLIEAFDRRGEAQLTESVLAFFYFYAYLMPTPATYPLILYHHRNTSNHGQFMRTLARIAGEDKLSGAKYNRLTYETVEGDRRLRIWASDRGKRTHQKEFVFQRAPLNLFIVDEILRGLLKFQLFDSAVNFFACCIANGVRVTSVLAKQIMDELLIALDWKGAVALVRQLAQDRNMWATMEGSWDDDTVAYLVDRIYSILDFIGLGVATKSISDRRLENLGISPAGFLALKNQVQDTIRKLPASLAVSPERGGPGIDDSLRASRSRLLQIESLDKELIRTRKTVTSEANTTMKIFHPLRFRVSMLYFVSDAAMKQTEKLCQEGWEALGMAPPEDLARSLLAKERATDVARNDDGAIKKRPAPRRHRITPDWRNDDQFARAFESRRLGLEEPPDHAASCTARRSLV